MNEKNLRIFIINAYFIYLTMYMFYLFDHVCFVITKHIEVNPNQTTAYYGHPSNPFYNYA